MNQLKPWHTLLIGIAIGLVVAKKTNILAKIPV